MKIDKALADNLIITVTFFLENDWTKINIDMKNQKKKKPSSNVQTIPQNQTGMKLLPEFTDKYQCGLVKRRNTNKQSQFQTPRNKGISSTFQVLGFKN